jgi:hypothetical protein
VLGSLLQGALIAGGVLTVLRLYRTGLYLRYPVFFSYFIFKIPHNTCPLFFDTSSNSYLHYWVMTEPIAMAFYVLMVVELYRLVLEKYKGLYTIGRWAMYLCSTISVTIAAIALIPRIRPTAPQVSKIMGYMLAGERGIVFSLAMFLILLLFFLTLFPVRLSRNVRVHALIYTVFFLSNTLALLLRALFGMKLADQVNVAFSIVSVCAVFAWLIFLRPEGEEVPGPALHLGKNYEERVLNGLSALNSTLLKVARR